MKNFILRFLSCGFVLGFSLAAVAQVNGLKPKTLQTDANANGLH